MTGLPATSLSFAVVVSFSGPISPVSPGAAPGQSGVSRGSAAVAMELMAMAKTAIAHKRIHDHHDRMAGIFRDRILEGKTALITGGSSGIGLRIAERFAEHGSRVVLVGRSAEKLNAARTGIEAKGGAAETAALDVRNYAAVEEAMQRCGPLDIVVAGAAGNFPAPVTGMSANGFKAVIDIDLIGTFHTARAAFEHLRRPGAVVLAISAVHATVPIALQSHVCAAKAGVELLVKTLAVEWGPLGVRCNCLTPGPTSGTEGMRRLAPTTELESRIRESIPLRRFGTKDELADLALFLCSDAAAYITGTTVVCDGGQSAGRLTLG
jgi:NAD(P)-dependent dehydrogenase (short-subunit alcohol dehydrogenase family)